MSVQMHLNLEQKYVLPKAGAWFLAGVMLTAAGRNWLEDSAIMRYNGGHALALFLLVMPGLFFGFARRRFTREFHHQRLDLPVSELVGRVEFVSIELAVVAVLLTFWSLPDVVSLTVLSVVMTFMFWLVDRVDNQHLIPASTSMA